MNLPDRKRSSLELVARDFCGLGAAAVIKGPGILFSVCRHGSTPETQFYTLCKQFSFPYKKLHLKQCALLVYGHTVHAAPLLVRLALKAQKSLWLGIKGHEHGPG